MSGMETAQAVRGAKPRSPGWWAALVALLLFLATIVATLFGIVPVLSSLIGTADAADLGVRYGDGELDSALSKIDGKGARVDIILTEAELSAYLTHLASSSDFTLDGLQVKVKPGNRFAASGTTAYRGREYPVYLEGKAEALPGGSPDSTLTALRVAGLPLPDSERRRVEGAIQEEIDRRLRLGDGFSLALLQTGNGTVRIVGRRG
jgi:hypothetical protein